MRWSRFGGDESAARAWIMRIARNALIDHQRRNRRVPFVELTEGQPAFEGGDTASRVAMRLALQCLQRDGQDLMAMRIAGLTHREIAAVTGRSEESVKKAWQRALVSLRSKLEVNQ